MPSVLQTFTSRAPTAQLGLSIFKYRLRLNLWCIKEQPLPYNPKPSPHLEENSAVPHVLITYTNTWKSSCLCHSYKDDSITRNMPQSSYIHEWRGDTSKTQFALPSASPIAGERDFFVLGGPSHKAWAAGKNLICLWSPESIVWFLGLCCRCCLQQTCKTTTAWCHSWPSH